MAIFFVPVLQLVGVKITYEGVERNLGVKSGRNYTEIVVVNRYADDFISFQMTFGRRTERRQGSMSGQTKSLDHL